MQGLNLCNLVVWSLPVKVKWHSERNQRKFHFYMYIKVIFASIHEIKT
jgi:hypothetical protein